MRLFGETVAPVAHPSLGLSALQTPEELEGQVLLEFEDAYRPWLRWSEWLTSQGWEGLKPRGILRYNQYDQMIHAAVGSQGVAIGRLELIGLVLADRRLAVVTLPQPGPATSHAYWLIRTPASARPRGGGCDALDRGRGRKGGRLSNAALTSRADSLACSALMGWQIFPRLNRRCIGMSLDAIEKSFQRYARMRRATRP